MTSVFLVESEKLIRDEVRKKIPWDQYGLCLVGEATDGEHARDEILWSKPDILIIDIDMPLQDGMELSELVRQELPEIKIIIISGVDQFIYASRALKIGVTDYLTKPVDMGNLLETLQKAKREADEEKKYKRYLAKLFLKELILGHWEASEIMDKSRKLHIDLSAKIYNFILFQYWRETRQNRAEEQGCQVEEMLSEFWEKHTELLYFDRGIEGGAILWKGKSEREAGKQMNKLLEELEEIFKMEPGLCYVIGVGKEKTELSEMPDCYREADSALSNRLSPRFKGAAYHRDESLKGDKTVQAWNMNKIAKQRIQDFLKNGKLQDVEAFVEKYCICIGIKNMQSNLFRRYILMDCSLAAISFVQRTGGDTHKLGESFSDTDHMAKSASSMALTRQYLCGLFHLCIELRNETEERGYQELLEKGKEYIERHYGDGKLSLNKVAAYVNVSPNYFSRLFKQQEHRTFVEYLTEIRMRRAKEMLRCTGLKTTEISRRLGYKDPHYFYALFKKNVGCTPGDYRMKSAG